MATDDKRVEIAAVRLLARREHGAEELKRKLAAKGHDAESVERVVEKLGAKRLVSDDRFVKTFVYHHAKRGQGPVRIRAELRQQGIEAGLVDQALAGTDMDWNRLAAEVRRRKFGASVAVSRSERAKQARFLQYRGFTADQIRAALFDCVGEGQEQSAVDDGATGLSDQDWPD
jgi:regulatory protein